MATGKQQPLPTAATPAMSYCRKKKSDDDDATFFEDTKMHIYEFIHSSLEEHKSCFKNTIQKMFNTTKAVIESKSQS